MNNGFIKVYIFLLVIVSLNYFDATFLPELITKYFRLSFLFLTIIISLPYFFKNKGGFILPVQLMTLAIFLSLFMAYYSWGQSFYVSLKVTIPYMLWVLFFFLLNENVSIKTIEKIVVAYGIIYIIFYFFQLANSDVIYFGGIEGFDKTRGITRVIFPGAGVFFLTTFIALNKFSEKHRPRLLWFLLAMFGLIIPILQVTRQYIIGTLLIYLYHFIKKQNIFKIAVYSILVISIGLISYNQISNNSIVKGLIEKQQNDENQGDNYIRILSGTYFLFDLSPNTASKILGNGFGYGAKSNYGNLLDYQGTKGFWMHDIGLIAIYAMFGVIALVAYFLIWFKSFTIPLPADYYYLKYYLWFLLLTSLTSFSIYHYHYLITTVFVIYCYQYIYNNKYIANNNSLT